MSDEGVISFPAKLRKPSPDSQASLRVVSGHSCSHGNFIVDEKLSEVECGICKAKLNPMWVLATLAMEESQLRRTWARLRAQIELMRPRLKTKCEHCGKLTSIPLNVKTWDVEQRAGEIINK